VNIWIVNHYATPPDTPGSTRHYDFARELIKHGHQVTIIASGFNHRTRKEERLTGKQKFRREDIGGIEFIWIKTLPYYKGNDWRRATNMLSYTFLVIPLGLKLKNKPDVVLASSPHPFAGLAGYTFAKIRRARLIFEVRDLWPQTLVKIGGYSSKHPIVVLLGALEKFLYRRASSIVVLHPKALNYINELGIPVEKITYIPNGVSVGFFSDTGVALPEELSRTISSLKSQGKLLVIYAGAFGIANALDTILETARLLQKRETDKIHFLLVGEGPEKPRLTEMAQGWELSNLTFFNPVPKTAIPGFLISGDIAVLAYRNSDLYTKYGMSTNKLWEYMMCARPVVWAINTTVNPVEESKCGLTVPAGDSEEMTKAIIKLAGLSSKERQAMRLRGQKYIIKNHSVTLLAERLLEVLR
jgi:glycosyltransferase involved in cell wall biosynthesis